MSQKRENNVKLTFSSENMSFFELKNTKNVILHEIVTILKQKGDWQEENNAEGIFHCRRGWRLIKSEKHHFNKNIAIRWQSELTGFVPKLNTEMSYEPYDLSHMIRW